MNIIPFSFLLIVLLFIFVFESVRRGVLETRYSLLWFATCIILGVLSLNEGLINWLAKLFGIYYAPSLLFLLGFLFSLIMIFDLTRRNAKLNKNIVELTQEFAILKEDLKKKDKI